ncbi:Bro-N domain-containing protein [Candidatus Nomurabacteria bacterium]|nr:Bro-N domain-containing protein [Candidatus Nomurabacteria bacterium]
MKKKTLKNIILFEKSEVRRTWYNDQWYFSVIDIIAVLSESERPRKYWDDLKRKLKEEGSELSEKIGQLKLQASDEKFYLTDVANLEGIFRIIQSIPSPKAEPFKQWLAKVGQDRIEEIQDPERAIFRAKNIYEQKGYGDEWIAKRMRGINIRNTLTNEWKDRGAREGIDFAILTNEIYKGTFELNAKQIKNYKNLNNPDNLRDHMDEMELILTMLGEATTTRISQNKNSSNFQSLKKDAKAGGKIAGNTRKQIENKTKQKVLRKENYLDNTQNKKLK